MTFLTKRDLLKYAEAVRMWQARFDTYSIAKRLEIDESVVASWIANFRDMGRGVAA
jgi:hypothetical protein